MADFCRGEGVSAANFYQWKKKLDGCQTAEFNEARAKFVPLVVTAAVAANTPTIVLPGGAVIELPAGVARQQLVDLIAAAIDATTRHGSTEVGP